MTNRMMVRAMIVVALLATGILAVAAAEVRTRILESDGIVLDLSELRDGESRTLGSGEKQVHVSRRGDVATIERQGSGKERAVKVDCQLEQDVCEVVTFDDDPAKVVVRIEKTRHCIDGEGDCSPLAIAVGDPAAQVIDVETIVDCQGDGDCIVRTGGEGGAVLRCPEGDTTMRVAAEDAGRNYLCPAHDVPLTRAGGSKTRVIKVRQQRSH